MPTSHYAYISDVVGFVMSQNPASLLDIGVGFGKWGHLFREYLDVMAGRVLKDQWQKRIDGVEIFEPYISVHQRNLYDRIYLGDICELVDTLPDYDMIFSSDVIEHIEKSAARRLIEKLQAKTRRLLLIIPRGEAWLHSQGPMYGNKDEAHVSSWDHDDLAGFQFRDYPCGQRFITAYFKVCE
jgi:hypothetical protein